MAQSPRLGTLWLTDAQNAGLMRLGQTMTEPFDLSNTFRIARWCDRAAIDLVVVGPEGPLAAGIADALASETRLVFGPTREGAMIEADKAWAKDLMRTASVAAADGRTFSNIDQALAYAESRDEGMVVKAAGLAAGKGVIVCDSPKEIVEAVHAMMGDRIFGDAGNRIVIEERLEGQEVSILALVDGQNHVAVLDPTQDHKQVGEGDTGPNTGGMGAYCPTPLIDDATIDAIGREILVPTVDALKREGIDYRGVLYAGLMLTPAGPKVLEFNCRFGDPECQPLMARLQGDLVEILWATAAGSLDEVDFSFDDRTAVTVVMCSGGYPGDYGKGLVITGVEEAESIEHVIVFHAGTRRNADGELVTNGGRVLAVTALGDDLASARDRALEACDRIHFEGAYYRRDIGSRVLTNSSIP